MVVDFDLVVVDSSPAEKACPWDRRCWGVLLELRRPAVHPQPSALAAEDLPVEAGCRVGCRRGRTDWHQLEELPPPARREGTCFGSAADIVLDPVRMAGRVAQWRCTDRSSRTARKLQAVMGRVSRGEESAGCFGRADAAFDPLSHNPAVVHLLPDMDCRPGSRDSHRSQRLVRNLAEPGTSPVSSTNLLSSLFQHPNVHHLAKEPKQPWPSSSCCPPPPVE